MENVLDDEKSNHIIATNTFNQSNLSFYENQTDRPLIRGPLCKFLAPEKPRHEENNFPSFPTLNKIEKIIELQTVSKEIKRNTLSDDSPSSIIISKEENDTIVSAASIKKSNEMLGKTEDERLLKIIENFFFQISTTLATIYALTADDFRSLFVSKSEDIIIDVFLIISAILFTSEIVISFFAKPTYRFGFFFYLDILSTFSIFFDISSIQLLLFYNTSEISNIHKTSLIGSKMGRIARLFRLVRLSKFYKKIYESQEKASIKKIAEIRANSVLFVDQIEITFPKNKTKKKNLELLQKNIKESRVGQKLSILTTKRLIILLLMMVFVTPFFEASYFYDSATVCEGELYILANLLNSTNEETFQKKCCDSFLNATLYTSPPLIYLKTSVNQTFCNYDKKKKEHLRDQEIMKFVDTWKTSEAIIDYSIFTKRNAIISIVRTIFIGFLMIFGGFLFQSDSNELALKPIERIMNKVDLIARNPLAKINEDNLEKATFNEIYIIENAIVKISKLLALGFGEAGSEIISNNMNKSGEFNYFLKGNKFYGVFSCLIIDDFDYLMEIFQEEGLIFFNNIAQIVDSTSHNFRGRVAWNIGEKMLLMWKFNHLESKCLQELKEQNNSKIDQIQSKDRMTMSMFDKSSQKNKKKNSKIIKGLKDKVSIILMAIIKIILNLHKEFKGQKFFAGIHIGWAIEGAMGSDFKVDPSYLSKTINLSLDIAQATLNYKTSLIFSKDFASLIKSKIKKHFRKINIAKCKLIKIPLDLLTIDLHIEEIDKERNSKNMEEFFENKFKDKKFQTTQNFNFSAKGMLLYDDEIKNVLNFDSKRKDFNKIFKKAMLELKNKDLKRATHYFIKCKEIIPEDGPLTFIMNLIIHT